MRFVIYWLIRGAAAALAGGFALFFWMYALEHVAISAASNPAELATLATMPPDEVGAIFRHMMLLGVMGGLITAIFALGAWTISKGTAFRWTGVVLTGPGDAVVHPATITVEALSPEAREKWLATYPDKSTYGFIVLGLLILSGVMISFVLSSMLEVPGAFIGMAYLWGMLSFYEIAEFGGSINRHILRWTGYPGEALVRQQFERYAGLRK